MCARDRSVIEDDILIFYIDKRQCEGVLRICLEK